MPQRTPVYSRSRWLASAVGLLMSLFVLCPRAFGLEDLGFGPRDEDMRIIGRDGSDEIGSSLAVGDVDGDGIDDILIGAPRATPPPAPGPPPDFVPVLREKAGEVALVFGAQDLSPELAIEDAPRTFYGAAVQERLGYAVAVGDVNDDGIGDIIIGAPEAEPDGGGPGDGAVYVFYGAPNVAAESITDLAVEPPDRAVIDLTVWGAVQNGRFGNRLAVGDFNDDGIDDIAMAAPREGDPESRPDAGNIYLFFGGSGIRSGSELTARISGLDAKYFMKIRGPTPYGIAGQSLAAGDVNGDGIDDLLIGAPQDQSVSACGATPRQNPGEMYIVFGDEACEPCCKDCKNCEGCEGCEGCACDDCDAIGPRKIIDLGNPLQVGVRVVGPLPNDRFGLSVGAADIDGDGVGDLLIGAPNSESLPALATGRVYAIFGRDFGPGTTINLGTTPADVSLAGPHGDAELGGSITGGDLNNDGIDEWIVGAPGAYQKGTAYRILGREVWPQSGVGAALTDGVRIGDRTGDVTTVGDVNGDGITDLIVSSPKFDGLSGEHPESGAVYVVLGNDSASNPNDECSDNDGDGFFSGGRTCGLEDCNDNDPDVHPGKVENCEDGIDNDCDGDIDQVDNECEGEGCTDVDGDLFSPEGGACGPVDCNDQDPAANPWALEDSTQKCQDGIDNDCDGAIDARDTGCGGPGCVDADHDAVCFPEDCDDGNQAVRPGIDENCVDGIDNDCDGAIDSTDQQCGGQGCTDADHDAVCFPEDCDDDDPAVKPGMTEDCSDGKDNDCDDAIDGIDTDCGGPGPSAEVCANCVDDNGNGLADLLDPACAPTPLTLKALVSGRLRKLPIIVKQVRIKTTITDAPLLNDASTATDGLTVGLAFDDGTQLCLPLDHVTRARKRKLVLRSSSAPKAKLRLKQTPEGNLKVQYKQRGKLQLSSGPATAIAFGIYGINQSYNGFAALRTKNAKTLATVKVFE